MTAFIGLKKLQPYLEITVDWIKTNLAGFIVILMSVAVGWGVLQSQMATANTRIDDQQLQMDRMAMAQTQIEGRLTARLEHIDSKLDRILDSKP